MKVRNKILLRSAAETPLTLTRTAAAAIVVIGSGASLTVTNLVVDGGGDAISGVLLLAKQGGALTLDSGAKAQNVRSHTTDEYGAAAVVALTGSSLTVKEGSAIRECRNADADGEGAGLRSVAATVVLAGGSISDCTAGKGASAVCGGGRVLVSGSVTFESSLLVTDASVIRLAGDFTGDIDVDDYDGLVSNEFGSVAADYLSTCDLQKLAAGAARFGYVGDLHVYGCVVTNATSGLLVWSSAINDDNTYVDEKGNVYGKVRGSGPAPEPAQPTDIAFKSISRLSDAEWTLVVTDRVERCEYRLLWTDDLTKGFVTTGGWEVAETDGAWTTNVVTSGGQRFWKAEARPEQVDK